MDLLTFLGDTGKIALGAVIGAVGGWIVARMSRDEARAARFADRVRELGAIVLDSARRFEAAIGESKEGVNLGNDVPRQIGELRLIARRKDTLEILSSLEGALWWAGEYRVGGPREAEPDAQRHKAIQDLRDLLDQLENAVRAELGMDPVPPLDF